MSGAQELAEQIEADKEQVAEAGGRIGVAKDEVAEVAAQAHALGLGRVAEALAAVERLLEEVESGRQTLKGSLEKARWQVMAAIHGVGPGAPTSRHGEATGGPDGAPPPGVPDILPPHLRTGDPSGEELMGQDPNLSPFEKEHENADADRNLPKARRLGRGLVRNVGNAKSYSEAVTDAATVDTDDGFDPWGPQAKTTTETTTNRHPGEIMFGHDTGVVDATDFVGNLTVFVAAAVEGFTRFVRRRGNDH
ncbi:hypothetical protein [Glycomyces salinus]|uniref:hypothetical protein n=1 Tax=Glycomyces salinus TaxID=980294 RepID=UPI0018EAEAE4|nr:hypothetical protein [Glycomyces salinus]